MKDNLIVKDGAKLIKRIAVLIIALTAYLLGSQLVLIVRKASLPLTHNCPDGPKLFLNHLFISSFPMALLCLITIFLFVKLNLFVPLQFKRNIKSSLIQGAISGLLIVIATTIYWILSGRQFQIDINGWSIAGNLFSNLWEEISFRGLIFVAVLYCFRIPWIAILISSLIFGLAHSQYPFSLKILVGSAGAVCAYVYGKTGNLLAPWLSHQITDTILDIFLKL